MGRVGADEAAPGALTVTAGLVPRTGRVRVGVDGVDGVGKSTFAAALVALLASQGRAVTGVGADDYLHPPEVRYRRGRHDPEGFYRDSVDTDRLRREVLDPFPAAAGRDAVLVVDGIFLQVPALRDALDLVVFLQAPFAATYRRMARRDGCPPDPDDPANRRYRLGQQFYLDEVDPAAQADVLVDHTDPTAPVVLRGPRC